MNYHLVKYYLNVLILYYVFRIVRNCFLYAIKIKNIDKITRLRFVNIYLYGALALYIIYYVTKAGVVSQIPNVLLYALHLWYTITINLDKANWPLMFKRIFLTDYILFKRDGHTRMCFLCLTYVYLYDIDSLNFGSRLLE